LTVRSAVDKVGLVGDKIGSPVDQGEPRGASPTTHELAGLRAVSP